MILAADAAETTARLLFPLAGAVLLVIGLRQRRQSVEGARRGGVLIGIGAALLVAGLFGVGIGLIHISA